MRLIDLLIKSAADLPKAIAAKKNGSEISYRYMLSAVRKLSKSLRETDSAKGIKIGIVLDNSIEYLISFFAVSSAWDVTVPLSGKMTGWELAKLIKKADVSTVITNRKFGDKISKNTGLSRRLNFLYIHYDKDNFLEIDTRINRRSKTNQKNAGIALMVPTSGTTGEPKIVMLTDHQLISNMAVYRLVMDFQRPNTVYCTLSFHHIYCICAQILTHISLADTLVISDKPFFAKDFLASVQEHKVNVTSFVPYMAIRLAEYLEPKQFELKSLKYVTLSGAKTPVSILRVLKQKFPDTHFINTYGMSEAGSRIAIAAPLAKTYPLDSVGMPMPGVEVTITDDEGSPLPPNISGEITVKSSSVTKGYYKQPELTRKTLTYDWLKTGDIGKLDEKGNLYILGRKKNLIVTGGYNVSPVEIEHCLLEHPAIKEAAVVGKKDNLMQEVPCAFLVKVNPEENINPSQIIKFCRKRLSSYKIPRYILFIEKMPKLNSSKINRNKLKKLLKS